MFKKVKEIRSKKGELHFVRWELFSIPCTTIKLYLHKILKEDEDEHPHDHPWNFFSLILKGGYVESVNHLFHHRKPGSISYKKAEEYHKVLRLFSTTYSLALVFGKKRTWGYRVGDGWVDFKTYRNNKNNI
jgi:hypothetical protein